MKRFNLIYTDNPWQYDDELQNGNRGAAQKYDTISVDRLALLRPLIDAVAADDCLLAMWWVPPMPTEALWLVEKWGFKLKTMKGFTWHKRTRFGKTHFGMGRWTRGNTEDCLFATRGKPKRVDAGISQYLTDFVKEHSAKPVAIRDRLDQLMGEVPRLEMFARQKAPGWEAVGYELDGLDIFDSMQRLADQISEGQSVLRMEGIRP